MKMKFIFASVLALAASNVFALDAVDDDQDSSLTIQPVRHVDIHDADIDLVVDQALLNGTSDATVNHNICIYDNTGPFDIVLAPTYNGGTAGMKLYNATGGTIEYTVDITLDDGTAVTQFTDLNLEAEDVAFTTLPAEADCGGPGGDGQSNMLITIPRANFNNKDDGEYTGNLSVIVKDPD